MAREERTSIPGVVVSYLVMARRWRPQRFADVVGQEHVTRTLRRAITRGRVAHAYIFTGPRGVGKTTTARLLAMAVNSEVGEGPDGLPDVNPEAPVCQEIAAGNAMDVIEIDGASNNKVDDVRQLRESIKYSPSALAKKVYIIDEIHMLSDGAFNALLKTLEEPPDHAMFIFATTEIHKVPATVLSRCQRYDFKRIPTREIRSQLERIVEGDELKVDDDAMVAIAQKAEGALRDALSVLDQLVAYQGDEPITGEVVRQALGLIGLDVYFRTTDMAATGRVHEALAIARDVFNGGHDPREFLRGLQTHILRLLALRAGMTPADLDVSDEDRQRYDQRRDALADEELLRIGEWAAEAEDLLRDALDPQVRLELLLVRVARMDRAVELGALLERMGVAPESFRQPAAQGNGAEDAEAAAEAKKKRPDPALGGNGPSESAPPAPSRPNEAPALQEERTEASGQTRSAAEDASASTGEAVPSPPAEPADEAEQASPEARPDAASPPLPAGTDTAEGDQQPPAPTPEARERGQEEGTGNASPEPATESIETTDMEDDEEEELPTGEEAALDLATLRQGWIPLCDEANSQRNLLGSALEAGAPTALEEETLEITFEPDDNFAHNQVMKHRDLIQKALRLQFGTTRRILLKKGTIPEEARPPRRITDAERARDRFRQALDQQPVWKEMVERLDLRPPGEA